MKKGLIAVCLALLAFPAQALDSTVVVTPVFKTMRTIADQPIELPQKNVEVVVSTYDIAPGAMLPVHQHHYQRYAYVLAGTLTVTNLESGKSATFTEGDFVVESRSEWHQGANNGTEPVKLLVIDQIEQGAETVTLKN